MDSVSMAGADVTAVSMDVENIGSSEVSWGDVMYIMSSQLTGSGDTLDRPKLLDTERGGDRENWLPSRGRHRKSDCVWAGEKCRPSRALHPLRGFSYQLDDEPLGPGWLMVRG